MVIYNMQCLYAYYAVMRMLCSASSDYMRYVFANLNFQWNFKHVLPYRADYPMAVGELLQCVRLFFAASTLDQASRVKQNDMSSSTSRMLASNS